MTHVRCSSCGELFPADHHGESPEFDHHDCPFTPPVIPGESFEDYKKRCEALKGCTR
mgnify:CR=1 FL=1